MRKKFTLFVAAVALLPLMTGSASAAFLEFTPKTAQFVSPKQKSLPKRQTANPPKAASPITFNNNDVKNLVVSTVKQMVAEGYLKGEKGDKGDPGTSLPPVDPDVGGIQPTYIMAGAVGPDVGTILGATILSADTLNSTVANLGNVDSSGNLTVAGDSDLQGNTTIASVNVGSLTSDSGAFLSDGGVWTNASSRELKENFATVSPQSVLEKINSLPLFQWNYKRESANILHLGPLAEDFFKTFGLGGEKGTTTISTIDPAGVALSGIQALSQKLNALLDFSWVLDGFKKLGVEIVDGLVKAKEFAADLVKTKELEVGSSDHPTGITIYDRATGEPVCVFSEYKVMKIESGKCGVSAQNQTQQEDVSQTIPDPVTPPVPEPEAVSSDSSSLNSILPPVEPPAESTSTDISMRDNLNSRDG